MPASLITALAASGLLAAAPPAPLPTAPLAPAPPVCRAAAAEAAIPDPFAITLLPTAHAAGAAGEARLRFASSPFGVALSQDGHHVYDLKLSAQGLPPREDLALVVWVATPDLDRVLRLGTLDAEGRARGRVHFNKFLVFVTAEPHPEVERWTGPILMRGISRSGRMHTMAGHGPFEGEPC